jgi:hypothetical protein
MWFLVVTDYLRQDAPAVLKVDAIEITALDNTGPFHLFQF